ncbi:DUF1102 domain-containing protein [Natronocalculus amylovorans]|uniref:DUF1102 domain-containing protein n=1 Tax=Natronocalculus amylovorans TaxID=2917812 RepID=A0AAE3FYG7_9EURY|nr:DUF1102 domain-containing protein [Natronocalculus amylovorans]MCL9816994.1 DUF1102 domain-containing protein [Natronocalculus amylovorans]
MERRKFVIGLGALVAGSGAAMGTGAFSSVQAERDLSVNISDDSSAYLELNATSPYARESDEMLELTFNDNAEADDSSPAGTGVNNRAITTFTDVFEVTNAGTQDVQVYVDLPDGVRMFSESYPDQDNGSSSDAGTPIDLVYWPGGGTQRGDPTEEWAAEDDNPNRDTPLVVPVGETMGEITVQIDTRTYEADDDEVTIFARAEDNY